MAKQVNCDHDWQPVKISENTQTHRCAKCKTQRFKSKEFSANGKYWHLTYNYSAPKSKEYYICADYEEDACNCAHAKPHRKKVSCIKKGQYCYNAHKEVLLGCVKIGPE